VNYNENFKPKSTRYNLGESSNFILTPVLSAGIRQLLEWSPARIPAYCESITKDALEKLENSGYFIEDPKWSVHHLFGAYLIE
jgi:hypothetical protein